MPRSLDAGEVLASRYRIDVLLGAGGMGHVYRAHDERLGRHVAIKLIAPALAADPERVRRFFREARAASALTHPNILTIHELGETDGVAFIVSELIEGETLRVRIDRRATTLVEDLALLTQVADGLAHAHAHGVVHLDLKPENVMVTPEGFAKILDFGIARLTEAVDGRGEQTLSDVHIVGTAGYMSPEQINGEPADHRADIFALGCLLYEVIGGKPAFRGQSKIDAFHQALYSDPPPLDERVPRTLRRIVERCLAKDRQARYQAVQDVAADLREVVRDEPALFRGGPKPPRARRLLLVAGGAAAVAAGFLIYATRPVSTAAPAAASASPSAPAGIDSVAVLPLRHQSRTPEDDVLAEGIMELLINELSAVPTLKVTSRTSSLYYRDAKLPLKTIAASLGVNGIVEGMVLRSGDRVRVSVRLVHAPSDRTVWAQAFDRHARETFAVQRDIAHAVAHEITGSVRTPLYQIRHSADPAAFDLYLRGRYHWNQRTREGLDRAVELFTAATREDPEYAMAYAGLANAYGVMAGQNLVPPAEGHRLAEAAATRALQLDPYIADAWATLAAGQSHYAWDFAAAGKSFRRALELNPNLATAHQWYAHYLQIMGRTEDAIAEMQRAVELDPLSPVVHRAFALLLTRAGRYEEAIRRSRRGLEIDRRPGGRRSLITAYEASGNYAAAAEELRKAPDLSGISPSEAAEIATAHARRGTEGYLRKRLEILLRKSARDFVSPVEIAGFHARIGDADEAMRWLNQAYAERSPNLVFMQVDPALHTLRDRSDFKELVMKVGLPPRVT